MPRYPLLYIAQLKARVDPASLSPPDMTDGTPLRYACLRAAPLCATRVARHRTRFSARSVHHVTYALHRPRRHRHLLVAVSLKLFTWKTPSHRHLKASRNNFEAPHVCMKSFGDARSACGYFAPAGRIVLV